VSKNQYRECPRMYQKTMVVRKSARTLRPGGEGGRRKNSGRGEPGSSTGRRGRRRLMRAGGGLGRPTRVATRWLLLGAAGAAGKWISGGIRSHSLIPGEEWERAHSSHVAKSLRPTPPTVNARGTNNRRTQTIRRGYYKRGEEPAYAKQREYARRHYRGSRRAKKNLSNTDGTTSDEM